ncbi:hypothetical protein EV359DRAFT_86069 [Lentinula novae-zelandiae]|nr:hypothetical protein EV359DRAFT_86069 [Lentinula novae-zelandiae]
MESDESNIAAPSRIQLTPVNDSTLTQNINGEPVQPSENLSFPSTPVQRIGFRRTTYTHTPATREISTKKVRVDGMPDSPIQQNLPISNADMLIHDEQDDHDGEEISQLSGQLLFQNQMPARATSDTDPFGSSPLPPLTPTPSPIPSLSSPLQSRSDISDEENNLQIVMYNGQQLHLSQGIASHLQNLPPMPPSYHHHYSANVSTPSSQYATTNSSSVSPSSSAFTDSVS